MRAGRTLVPRLGLRVAVLAAAWIGGAAIGADGTPGADGASAPGSAATPMPRVADARPTASVAWDFEVRLDGKPIGTHRFVVEGEPGARTVRSLARFDVKLLGLTVFRYRHEASERWRGDCLQAIQSRTDDDGKPAEVNKTFNARGPSTTSPSPAPAKSGAPSPQAPSTSTSTSAEAEAETDCLMSYAYWHPELVRQQRLLNPQTGEVDEVRIERLPDASLAVAGREVEAMRWRLTATPPAAAGKPAERQQLTLWRDRSDGRWIGLDAVVKGGRVLSYRLP